MDPRFVTRKMHAWLDYPVALSLIGLPFLLQLGSSNPLALWLAVATGVAALVLTLLTDHELGVVRVLPYRFHVAVDAAVGAVFVAAPSVFGFAGVDAWYYWLNGTAVLLVVGLHRPSVTASPAVVIS
jgi:hypothetical protein